MSPAVPHMDDHQTRLYYARLRGEALGIEHDAREIGGLLEELIKRPRTPIEEMPLDLAAWFPTKRNTIEHIRSEVLLMAGSKGVGVRGRIRGWLRR